jgi:hypothetical protein
MTNCHTCLSSSSVCNSECRGQGCLAEINSALAMVGGLVTPPILLAGPAGANLGAESQLYLVSACLIWCGVGTAIQVSRFKIAKTKYYFGTGLISVVGTSFAFTNVALSYLAQSYANGTCQMSADGKTKLVSLKDYIGLPSAMPHRIWSYPRNVCSYRRVGYRSRLCSSTDYPETIPSLDHRDYVSVHRCCSSQVRGNELGRWIRRLRNRPHCQVHVWIEPSIVG